MAVSIANKFTGSGSAAGSFTTASWTPNTSAQYLLTVIAYVTTGSVNPPTPTISGNGLTWTLLGSVAHDTLGADRASMFVFAASGTGGTVGTMSIGFASTTPRTTWLIDEVTGANPGLGSGTLRQPARTTSGASATSLSVTLSALGSGSVTWGALGWQSSGPATAGSGYTKLADNNGQLLNYGFTEWNSAGSTTVAVTMSGTNRSGLIGLEIATPSTGASGGATTSVTVSTSAAGQPARMAGSTATATISASGTGIAARAHSGESDALVSVGGTGTGSSTRSGGSTASTVAAGLAGASSGRSGGAATGLLISTSGAGFTASSAAPPRQTFTVLPDIRVATTPAEGRALAIPAEGRRLVVPA